MDIQEKTAKVLENKNKIFDILKNRGPSLPVHISSELKISMLFASAFLSELLSEKKIKISHMRVGGSPLYFISGQEPMLANFSNYLHSKEKDAFVMLKENSVLEDEKQLPAIRVALRSINDFALPLTIETPNAEKKLFWRFLTASEDDAREMIAKITAKKEKPKPAKLEKAAEQTKEKIEGIETGKEHGEKPLITLKEKKPKKPAEKSDFAAKSVKFLEDNKIELLEEMESKKKDFIAKVRIESDLGKIEFFALFKDKKKITENDFTLALQKGQSIKLPILFVSTGEPDKKAQAYIESWKNMIRFKKMP
ncbi:hypothetical protein HYT26_03820 [Candidatus Pacearchaeota archaeon]|nr:hypothetical protein [Candidatus Pacearchaeota archaeon]